MATNKIYRATRKLVLTVAAIAFLAVAASAIIATSITAAVLN